MLDRAYFFAAVRRAPFDGSLSQHQVDGMNYLLDVWERFYRVRTSITQLAYCLGTTKHETNHTMQPIKEIGSTAYFMKMYDKTGARPDVAARLGNTQVGDGAKFAGMGNVQSTGRGNARRATKRLRELGIIGDDVDFEVTPELLMRPDLAAHILFIGMEEGWFTGKTLDGDIDDLVDGDEFADFVRARRIVNGKDRAEKIATYSMGFLDALVAATTPAVPSPPLVPIDVPAPIVPRPAAPTLIQRIKALFGF